MLNLKPLTRALLGAGVLGALLAPYAAAQDEAPTSPLAESDRTRPPSMGDGPRYNIDFVDAPIADVIKYFAEITGRNFILTDDLKGEITIISNAPVSKAEAYEAFLSALEVTGYTTVQVGSVTKVVSTGAAANAPLRVGDGDSIPYTDNFVTQIFQLDSVSVSDVSSVVKQLSGKSANIIAYSPTNTLIVTDSAMNIRRMWKVVSELDVAAPKSGIQVIPIIHAQASEIKTIIEEIYGTEETSTSSSSTSSSDRSTRRRRRRNQDNEAGNDSGSATSTSVGKESKYISKIVSDERTNSLIIMANETALSAIMELIQQLDVDVDPSSRAQIHVIYLEHAKAEEIAQVLSNLSEDSSSNSRNSNNNRNPRPGQERGGRGGDRGGPQDQAGGGGDVANVTAALADGVKITSDESTNSLVIVANPESFQILKSVIDRLDIRRPQVFVEAVIMEVASEDSMDLGVGYHAGLPSEDGSTTSIASFQLNGDSTLQAGGFATDVVSGMAMGVFGEYIDVNIGGTSVSIPSFGVALNAIQANASTNILSTPNILTLDNEEAKIVVGRNIPFPISSGRDSNNNPIISYQREDVAITLQVTPHINESNYVTLEIFQEVTEIEEDSQGLDVTSAGFITSKRSAETVVLAQDNQTIVIGGLMGRTETEVETKIPILGDLPLIGALFRGKRTTDRKTNLLIFLTPHVIHEPADLEEVYRVKIAQREEFLRRFYGKSEAEQQEALNELLRYSMNIIDEPSVYRTKVFNNDENTTTIGELEGDTTEAVDDLPEAPPAEEPPAGDSAEPTDGAPAEEEGN